MNSKKGQEYLNNLRHSCSHLLAAAVDYLYPNVLQTTGPEIENGFYHDFDFGDTKISDEDLPKIESKMYELVKDWHSFEERVVTISEAKKYFKNNPYKIELIDEFASQGKKITLNDPGNFLDLCKGGHVENPRKEIKHFRLLSIAGAYWRGNEKNKMLTRIYGTAFPTQEELEKYLNQQEEAKKRDHRKLGKELDLFTISEHVGSGLPLYTPKGALVRKLLNDYIREEQSKLDYTEVWTPQIAKAELFKLSGHYDKYKDDMFRVISNYSDEEFFLKPMNCPQHTQIYASKPRSYKDLPLRYADFAMLYRDEKPGELGGLSRVRSFSTDDCHIFCREDQVDEEIDKALEMTMKIMKTFDLKYRYRLSTRDPEKKKSYLGNPKTWDKVEKWAVRIMKRNKISYYDGPGEAAFYAPKMDLMATDALGREWQLSTIQIDYVQPERFGLKYIDRDGSEEMPIMIHRAVLGSAERFMSIMIEHFAGAFPVWLSPVQVKVLPITDKSLGYTKDVASRLKESNIRTEVDERSETLQAKIRNAQLEKIPYMLVIGEREQETRKVALRLRTGEDQGQINLSTFITNVSQKIQTRDSNL